MRLRPLAKQLEEQAVEVPPVPCVFITSLGLPFRLSIEPRHDIYDCLACSTVILPAFTMAACFFILRLSRVSDSRNGRTTILPLFVKRNFFLRNTKPRVSFITFVFRSLMVIPSRMHSERITSRASHSVCFSSAMA